jgi:hypothetical protein
MSNRRRRRPVTPCISAERDVEVPLAALEDVFTTEDKAHFRKVMDLEAAGDLVGALRLLRRGTRVRGAGHERHLTEMVRLGDSAPAWAWSRLTVGAAYRWALVNADPRTDLAVIEVYAATYLDVRKLDKTLGTSIAACDALASDLVVFDLGVLQDYLDVCAGRRLLEAAAGLGEWVESTPSVYRLGGLSGDRLVIEDEVSGAQPEVLHTGEAMGTARDEWVLGRVVPDGAGGRVFASRPVIVGERAGRLLRHTIRSGGGWRARLEALHTAIKAGELETRPGWRAGAFGLTFSGSLRDNDTWHRVGPLPPAPRIQELMDEGMSQQTAEHLGVLEYALEIVRLDVPGTVEMVAQHAAIALKWPEVREQALRRYAAPEHRAAWLQLGSCLPPQARAPFDALAAACPIKPDGLTA